MKVSDAIDFIRKYKVLERWTDEEIALALNDSLNRNSLVYAEDKNGIYGLIFGKIDPVREKIHIICAIAPGKLQLALRYFKSKFPNYKLSMYRKGKYKELIFK